MVDNSPKILAGEEKPTTNLTSDPLTQLMTLQPENYWPKLCKYKLTYPNVTEPFIQIRWPEMNGNWNNTDALTQILYVLTDLNANVNINPLPKW